MSTVGPTPMPRSLGLGALAVVVAVALLWLVPPVGFVAALVLLVILPPWGRTLTERGVISAVVLIGVIAVLFPRAGSTPVSGTTAKLLLAGFLAALLILRLLPALRATPTPLPTLSDGLVLALGIVSGLWLMAAYIGRNSYEIVSGLFFSGWDNQGHYTTFANTYASGSTTWPTIDGSIAWNQWYPSLHSTVWSLAEYASTSGSAHLDREGLIWPFVLWSAISFAGCLAALAWVAGDVAARFGGRERERWSRPLAVAAFSAFALLGSPAYLFNAGFTNFMMGVTIVVVAAYVSARSLRSARTLGWFLIPLGALAAIGLWTPLVLGLVPSGVVVAIALLSYRRVLGAGWLVATVAIAVVMALTQTAAILGVEPGTSTGDFTADLGAVGTGMVPFNVGMALLAPVIAALFAVLLVRSGRWPMAVAILGPIVGAAAVAIVFSFGADAADLSRLQSYYVLKPLDAMLIAVATLIAALASVALTRALAGTSRSTSVIGVALSGAVLAGLFGYVGALPSGINASVVAAPGIQAGADRTRGVNDPLVGEAIVRAAEAAVAYPDDTTLLWDGAGTLPNLWVGSLHGVLSSTQQRFYRGLPSFPYDDRTPGYVDLALNLNPELRVAALWFRPVSGVLLDAYAADRTDGRVTSVRVPMPSNLLCPECSL